MSAGVASVRRDQELCPCQTEMCPDGSRTDLLQPKAEPLSSAVGTSVITYSNKVKKCCAAAVRKSEKNVEETALQAPR